MWEILFGLFSATLCEELFNPPTKTIYCYGEYERQFAEFPSHVDLVKGIPNDLYNIVNGYDNSLVVLDDLMLDCSNN